MSTEHKSRAKDPAIVHEAQKPIRFLEKIIWCIVLVVAVIGLVVCIQHYHGKRLLVKNSVVPTPRSFAPQGMEGLELQKVCLTPCPAYIGWDYRVWTGDHPVQVRTKDYRWEIPAVGVGNPPKNFKPGEAEIVSLEENNPHVNVWVYKKI